MYKKIKIILFSLLTLSVATLTLFSLWIIRLDKDVRSRIESQWFLPPVEIYSAPMRLTVGTPMSLMDLQNHLKYLGFRWREPSQPLWSRDFSTWDKDHCQTHLSQSLPPQVSTCVIFRYSSFNSHETFSPDSTGTLAMVTFPSDPNQNGILGLYQGEPLASLNQMELDSHLFAQFYGDQPILRQIVQMGDVPLSCLQAVTAIEDSDFLEHRGVSFSGLIRALLKNLYQGRYAQGGSTITQQLVKVYFLNSKKTLKRKITELFMALLLEFRSDKDQILTNYLNAIYMGQNGPFQVVGFGAAAQHYFQKNLMQLNLPECALLAAIINNPGRFNPFSSPQPAFDRRKKVLSRMQELRMIDTKEQNTALTFPLPERPPHALNDPAPYFVQSIEKEIKKLNFDPSNGLRVYTTLNEKLQEIAQETVSKNLEILETKLKQKSSTRFQNKELQSSLISIDVSSGHVQALVGGRSFKRTQFNRAINGHRQIGSIVKPLVFLTALEMTTPDGKPYTPLTLLQDQPFTFKYQHQVWKPENYEHKYRGQIPLFVALKNSINVPTAQLGISIGLENIIDVARRTGIQSPIEPLPALTLGSFELYPLEVAESYLTLARMGNHLPLTQIQRVETLSGETLYSAQPQAEVRFAPENVAVLVGMMKQTVLSGTARSLASRGFFHPAAGKTGTTSDSRDAWFAGFTPELLTVVWVGYDDNSSHGLTGASGALPLWADYMMKSISAEQNNDFTWPESTVVKTLTWNHYNELLSQPEKDLPEQDFSLVFRQSDPDF